MKNGNEQLLFWASVSLLAAGVFACNYFTPLYSDDFQALMNYYGSKTVSIGLSPGWADYLSQDHAISRALGFMWHHYLNCNGRFLSNFLIGLMVGMPRFGFALINTLFVFAFIGAIIKLSGVNKKWWIPIAFGACFLLLTGNAVFWRSGAINYL